MKLTYLFERKKKLKGQLKKVAASQNKAAEAMGVDKSAVSRWVNGERVPSRKNLEKLKSKGIDLNSLV